MKVVLPDAPSIVSSVSQAQKTAGPLHYTLGSNGVFKIVKIGGPDLPVEAYAVRKTFNPDLPEINPGLFLKRADPVPRETILKALDVCRRAAETWNSEFILVLRWRNGGYVLDKADFGAIGPGDLNYHISGSIVGTIHSHGAHMGAFFSSTDDRDDLESLGIHIVFGYVCNEIPQAVASFAGEGQRISVNVQPFTKEEVESVKVEDEEFAFFTKGFQTLDFARSKKKGYLVKNGSGRILQWTETRAEAEELAGKTLDIEEVKPPRKKTGDWRNTYGRVQAACQSLQERHSFSAHVEEFLGYRRTESSSPAQASLRQVLWGASPYEIAEYLVKDKGSDAAEFAWEIHSEILSLLTRRQHETRHSSGLILLGNMSADILDRDVPEDESDLDEWDRDTDVLDRDIPEEEEDEDETEEWEECPVCGLPMQDGKCENECVCPKCGEPFEEIDGMTTYCRHCNICAFCLEHLEDGFCLACNERKGPPEFCPACWDYLGNTDGCPQCERYRTVIELEEP
jgi:hypothetical protein